jgi:hypothetical protein
MIAELALIVQLLAKLSLQAKSTPPTVGPPSFKPIVSKPMQLDLFKLGKIEEIKQPLIIDPTKIDYGQVDWKPDYKKGRF